MQVSGGWPFGPQVNSEH